jgi:hypothetical protein
VGDYENSKIGSKLKLTPVNGGRGNGRDANISSDGGGGQSGNAGPGEDISLKVLQSRGRPFRLACVEQLARMVSVFE